VEEKLLMTPGDIAMLLNETAGLRVQPSGSSLGGASVRIQGLRGRYTQILSDGLPLHGGQTGALGPLQIPPMDLGQVEVIKGAASALYGASALGGVVNLISRQPEPDGETELLLNQTTLDGSDAILWRSAGLGPQWGYTLLASGHRQSRADVDEDGWADLPGFRRGLVRPRLFWDDGQGGRALLTVGAMAEYREGGTLPGRTTPEGATVREELHTERLDGGVVARFVPGGSHLLTVRGSAALQRHDHRFGTVVEEDVHATAFAEAALSGTTGAHTWVLGGALQFDDFQARSLDGFDYAFTVPGAFVQDEYAAAEWLMVSASGRLDHHSQHGTFLNPRLSVLLRPADAWTVRASAGTGYLAPTPWTDETEAVGLSRLVPFHDLEAERARTASLDVGRTIGPIELNATAFGSRIEEAVQVRPAPADEGRFELFNARGPVRTYGTELLARYHREGIHVTATHVFLRSTEPAPEGPGRRVVPLTARHTAGLVAAWEQEERGRIGVEFYYTGRQQLEGNPYRDASVPHAILGFLVERRFGRARLFLNAENLLDTRQTLHDLLVLPARSPQGRWTTDVWGPLEGRAFNGGVRWEF
jgi:iron complex outermembrane receptor protein